MRLLAYDLGGTRIKIGVVEDGKILCQTAIPAYSQDGLIPRLANLKQVSLQLCEQAGLSLEALHGAGIAFPSLVDHQRGVIHGEKGKYADVVGLDLPAWFKNELGLPLAIENDARMALIGEWLHGAGKECNNLVQLTLGTGIGSSALIDGKILRGVHGQAGCLGGHFSVNVHGAVCDCGNVGCAELEASTSTIGPIARNHPHFASSVLVNTEVIDYEALFSAYGEKDVCATDIIDHTLKVWGALTVSLIHAYDPERVILGGGIMKSGDIILPAIQNYVEKHARTPWGTVEIVPTQLGDSAALLACEWLLKEKLEVSE